MDLFTDGSIEPRYCICADPENCREPVPGYVCRPRAEAIPFTRDQAIARFLNRWLWRADRAEVEMELRELLEMPK